jgi:serine/threonine protein kinase
LGPISPKILKKSKRIKHLFDKKLHLKGFGKDIPLWSLTNVLIEDNNINENVAIQVADFLKNLLKCNPKERYTSLECLNHPWLVETKII